MNNTFFSIHTNPDSIPVVHSNWYPPIKVSEENLKYAQILIPDLASATSEMTTVHQYLYQTWIIDNNYISIGRVIKRIAVVEQFHYSIIGQLIALLGGQPECRSIQPTSYWRGDMVDYSRNIHSLLSKNAESEQFAMNTYLEQSREIEDPYISKILARLSLDEKLHYKIFSDFLSQV